MRRLLPEIDEAVSRLRRQDPVAPDALRAEVTAHLDRARAAAAQSPFVDLARATQVSRALHALLDDWDATPEALRPWVQAACRYFAEADDGEDDFASIVGFDDDAEVLNHVCDRLGRADLMLPLD